MDRKCISLLAPFIPPSRAIRQPARLIAPIYQTSTYEQESPGVNLGFDYSRTNNPTRQRLEDVLAGSRRRHALRGLRVGPRRRTCGAARVPAAARRDHRSARRLRWHVPAVESRLRGFRSHRHAGRYGRSRRGARGDHRAHAAGLAGDADQSAADRVRHRRRSPASRTDTARSSSSTTRSRRRSSSSRSRSAPTSSCTA